MEGLRPELKKEQEEERNRMAVLEVTRPQQSREEPCPILQDPPLLSAHLD